jgi:pyridoxamine 5'-phosphate oxidase
MDEHDLDDDPIAQLGAWLEDARVADSRPHAMTLATADTDGRPSARVVLLQSIDARGVVFFTNRTSRKGRELGRNPFASGVLHWWDLGRQVRIEGGAEETTEEESIAYWITRPRGSQIAAWASAQSMPLAGRAELEASVAEVEARFAGREVSLPPFWGGYRIVPDRIEFWTHRDDRLHDRVLYVRAAGGWRRERLAP